MTTSQILELDCRIEKSKEIIQKTLRQIKPLAKCPEGKQIPIEKIERCFKVLCNKYDMCVPFAGFSVDAKASDEYVIWRCKIETLKGRDVGTAYGCTFYECMAKAVILMYSKTRSKR